MKSILVLLLFLILHLTLAAQIDFDNPPWGERCDTKTSQSEMNMCSYENFIIADSILNTYYDSIFYILNSQYLNELEFVKDTTGNFQKAYLKQLKEQTKFVLTSKKDFEKFRSSTTKIIEYQYKGGTIQPMAVNLCALDLTVKQIRVLINLLDEIEN